MPRRTWEEFGEANTVPATAANEVTDHQIGAQINISTKCGNIEDTQTERLCVPRPIYNLNIEIYLIIFYYYF